MKKLRIVLSIMLVLLITAPYCYADTVSIEDDQINIEVPSGWEYITSGHFSDKAGEFFGVSESGALEFPEDQNKLFLGEKTFADGSTSSTSLIYMDDTDGQTNYDECSEDELKDYYKDYGEDIVNSVLQEDSENTAMGKPEIMHGDEFTFMRVAVENEKVSTLPYRVYYTVKEGVVISFVFTSYGGGFTKGQIADAETMVNSFYDSGYYYNSTTVDDSDSYEDDSGYYEDDDDEFWVMLLVFFLIVPIAIAYGKLKKTAAGRTGTGSARPATAGPNNSQDKPVRAGRTPQETISGQPQNKGLKTRIPKFRMVKADGKMVKMQGGGGPKKARTSDESYLTSLETLLDSGLVTKDEYREMIDKYKNKRR